MAVEKGTSYYFFPLFLMPPDARGPLPAALVAASFKAFSCSLIHKKIISLTQNFLKS